MDGLFSWNSANSLCLSLFSFVYYLQSRFLDLEVELQWQWFDGNLRLNTGMKISSCTGRFECRSCWFRKMRVSDMMPRREWSRSINVVQSIAV